MLDFIKRRSYLLLRSISARPLSIDARSIESFKYSRSVGKAAERIEEWTYSGLCDTPLFHNVEPPEDHSSFHHSASNDPLATACFSHTASHLSSSVKKP